MRFPSWPNLNEHKTIRLGLDRVYELLARLGDPHLKLPPTIHLAGTNGKGSIIAFLGAILNEAGYVSHRYTSPHLVDFNERMIIADKQISEQYLNEITAECKEAALKKPEIEITFFEATTVAAFLAFSRSKADILLLETGMGGRLDATNCLPEVFLSIITPISIDHQEFLGKTLRKIAHEKAGIIKNKCPVIIAKQKKSVIKDLKEAAIEKNSPAKIYGIDWNVEHHHNYFTVNLLSANKIKSFKLELPSLAGNHQLYNAATAITALFFQDKFVINEGHIKKAITNVTWPARLQKITQGKFFDILSKNLAAKPKVNFELILDGSHNEDGSKTIKSWIKSQPKAINYFIFAMVKDKNCKKFLSNLKSQINYLMPIAIENEDRSKNPKEIARTATIIGIKSSTATSLENAINKITKLHRHHQNLRIIICGSLYLAGVFLRDNAI